MTKSLLTSTALTILLATVAGVTTATPLFAYDAPISQPDGTVAAAIPPVVMAANAAPFKDGTFTGPVTDAYYGDMQVRATVTAGKIVAVDVLQYPNDRNTSRRINARALPELQSEVIKAQSVHVHAVSGATLTSDAYLKSLARALQQASS